MLNIHNTYAVIGYHPEIGAGILDWCISKQIATDTLTALKNSNINCSCIIIDTPNGIIKTEDLKVINSFQKKIFIKNKEI